jgi:serine phosphatase RsbU (regulator of sigma subunit)
MSDMTQDKDALKKGGVEDVALRKILEGTASHTGKEFFRALVKNLSEALGTKGAWVTEYLPQKEKLRALAFWMEGDFIDGYEFEIPGTPCEKVMVKKQLFHVPDNIIKLFPDDPSLKTMGAASYLGTPLLDVDGSTILGHLAVLHSQPMPEEARNVALFKIFANRAASELRRISAENQLRKRTEELQEEYQRKSAELADARNMQLNMLPQAVPFLPDYQFAFSMRAASEVGGDYYDYQMSNENILTFGIGDATGHGLQASVMVTAIKLLFSEHAAETDIISFLKQASRSISLMDFRKLYMAFAIGRLTDNTLQLAGAGMPPAVIYRSRNKMIEELELKGMPLGSRISYPYAKVETHVNPGDIVVLMTDGLPELFNDKGEMFGYKRVLELIKGVAGQSPDRIIGDLYSAARAWRNGSKQDDDMTFFVFKRKASS